MVPFCILGMKKGQPIFFGCPFNVVCCMFFVLIIFFCQQIFCNNNLLFVFQPFDTCTEMFGNETNRRICTVIFYKCRRIKFDILAVYNGILCTYGNKDSYIFISFKVFTLNCYKLFRALCLFRFRYRSFRRVLLSLYCP